MLVIRQTELSLPLCGENRGARGFGFPLRRDCFLIHLCGGEVERKQIFPVGMDQFTEQFITVVRVPIHKGEYLRKKEFAGYLLGSTLTFRCAAPKERVPLFFLARAEGHDFGLLVNQCLHIIGIRELRQASGVDIEFTVVEGNRRLV